MHRSTCSSCVEPLSWEALPSKWLSNVGCYCCLDKAVSWQPVTEVGGALAKQSPPPSFHHRSSLRSKSDQSKHTTAVYHIFLCIPLQKSPNLHSSKMMENPGLRRSQRLAARRHQARPESRSQPRQHPQPRNGNQPPHRPRNQKKRDATAMSRRKTGIMDLPPELREIAVRKLIQAAKGP